MAEELRVVITAKDGASRVFKEVGAAAGDVGTQAEKAGEKGERGFKRMGDAAQKTKVDTAALGAALTALGAGLAYSSAMAMQQERSMIALQRAFGENADEVIRFSQELDDLSIFSDDDIRAGARYFATLQNNYDLTIDQVKELMSVTSELAAASGTTFEDASSRVTAAIRGEGEAAEYLGLTMNQQSIDRQNLTLSMTNQEAAQFRLNALMQQAAPYMGTNNDLLQTGVGTVNNYKDALQDTAAAVGGFLGPAGTMISAVGTLGLGLTGLTTGTNAAKAGLDAVTKSGRAASILGTVLNPWVLGATAAVAVGVALWNNYREGAEVIETLKDAYLDLQAASQQALISGNADTAAYLDQLRFQAESVRAEADLIHQKMQDQSQYVWNGVDYSRDDWLKLTASYEITGAEAERLASSQQKLGAALQDTRLDGAAIAAEMDNLYWQFMRGEISADEYIFRMENLANTTSQYVKSTEEATESTTRFGAALKLVTDEADGWVQKLLQINAITEDDSFLQKFMKTLGVNATDRAAVNETLGAFEDIFTIGENMPGPGASHQEWMDWVNEMERGTYAWRRRVAVANQAMAENAVVTEEAAEVTKEATVAQAQLAEEMANVEAAAERQAAGWDMLAESIEASIADSILGILELTGNADIVSQLNFTQAATEASLLAENVTDAATALDNLYRIIVGNTDALGSQMQNTKDWADNLIGDPGVWAEVDALLAEGRISLDKYNDAQQAQIDITEANATAQRDLLAIQASQAPIIAGGAQNLADYIEKLRQMNDGYNDAETGAQDQLAALALMDSGYQNQLLQVMQMADALDDLGPSGEAAFKSMIDGMIALDPAMAAVLEQVGFIDNVVRDDSGRIISYEVKIGGADGAMSEIELLTESIMALIDVLEDGSLDGEYSFTVTGNTEGAEEAITRTKRGVDDVDGEFANITLYGDGSPAIGSIDDVKSKTLDLDGSVATVEIELRDYATPGITAAQLALDALNGTTATTTIRTIYETQGLGPSKMYGGVVDEYASGGVVIRAGEISPEIVHYANGGTAVLPYDGLYSVPAGSYISPGHASVSRLDGGSITVNVNGPVFGVEDLAEQVMGVLTPAIEAEKARQRRGLGVA